MKHKQPLHNQGEKGTDFFLLNINRHDRQEQTIRLLLPQPGVLEGQPATDSIIPPQSAFDIRF
jgi:hypothetical protein